MTRKQKPAIKSESLVARVYPLLEGAVEAGIARGWRRAHKHTDTPGEDAICSEVYNAVMGEICERFVIRNDSED